VERTDGRSLFRSAKHPYTEGLLGSLPKLGQKTERLQTIEGVVPSPFNMPEGCRFHPRCKYARDICAVEQPELLKLAEGHEAACFIHTDYKSMREKVG
ncbi:MAG: peptide ABC transporter substrate-binding protein, partial [Limnochordales bacterium]